MGRSYSQVYVHLVWGTVWRRPLLTPGVQAILYPALRSTCRELGGYAIAVGGVEDHVHILVQIPTSLSVAVLAQRLKGSSAHLLNHAAALPQRIRWQVGYGAFSVSRRHLPVVRKYIREQPLRHARGRISPALEQTEPPPQSAQPTSRGP